MADGSSRFDKLIDRVKDDPLFIAQGLAMDIALQMGETLEKRKMTQKELAQILKVSPPYISGILNGTPNLTLLTLSKLSIALELSITISLAPKNIAVTTSRTEFCEDYDLSLASARTLGAGDSSILPPKLTPDLLPPSVSSQNLSNAAPPSVITLAA